MATEKVPPPAQIVKISNQLARSRINVSGKTATDILACLIANVKSNDTKFSEVYSIEVKNYFGNEGAIFKYVRQACKELASATVEDEWIEENEENPEDNKVFLVMPLFMSLKYKKGTIEASFNPKTAKYLLEQKTHFTQLLLPQFRKLPSVYSKHMFRLLKSFAFLPDVMLSVSDLHKHLDTPPIY